MRFDIWDEIFFLQEPFISSKKFINNAFNINCSLVDKNLNRVMTAIRKYQKDKILIKHGTNLINYFI